ncbi:HNH endonuclease [Salinispirillum marinum]|uniref:HNH endonuclease n=2 Tax=Saccharospirillaceae TaxID=255527 RepID=A0ABV8BCP6_9GAMM
MELRKPLDILALKAGDTVSKKNLNELIQQSKIEGSAYWAGEDLKIGNTPQQGINWVGALPECRAVIIKSKLGSYDKDGWDAGSKEFYRYSFKARSGQVSQSEKANKVLINQPQFGYPILLFTEQKFTKRHLIWIFEGAFRVSELEDTCVKLARLEDYSASNEVRQQEAGYLEGGRKYVSHLLIERNRDAALAVKKTQPWVCDICSKVFSDRYGVEYIEAHHKVPVSTYSESYKVQVSDFALLCPNCHTAVHILMRTKALAYSEIKEQLK